MADSHKRQRGRPRNLSDPIPLHLHVPKAHHEFLKLLAKRGRLGVTTAEVATHVLIRELDVLFKDGYHDLKIPED